MIGLGQELREAPQQVLVQGESEPALPETMLQSGESDILAQVADLQGGLVEAGKIVPQALSLVLSDVEEGGRSQTPLTTDGKVRDKEAGELVEGVDGIRFQPCEPGSRWAMESHRERLSKKDIRCSVQQHNSSKALDMVS